MRERQSQKYEIGRLTAFRKYDNILRFLVSIREGACPKTDGGHAAMRRSARYRAGGLPSALRNMVTKALAPS